MTQRHGENQPDTATNQFGKRSLRLFFGIPS